MSDEQGFESPKHQYHVQSDKIYINKCKKSLGNSILKQTRHSLEPDMVTGWKPKLPSCPLPLTYLNHYNEELMKHIPTDDRFKIVYLGKRFGNSVQINQQYSYHWKYRQRYSLNIAIIQQAIKNCGYGHKKLTEEVNRNQSKSNLAFDSSFQSGNLQIAVKVKPNQYDLFLRSDTNTKGHTNWYYFKVNNQNYIGTVQLNICNMGKSKTLYKKGMKPYVLEEGTEIWSQDKTLDVFFVQRYCRYGFQRKSFQLQFKYQFKEPNTEVYFAYGIPYTYSKLEKFIKQITKTHQNLIRCQNLCQSLGGLNIPLLTISDENFINPTLKVNKNLQKNEHVDSRDKYEKEMIAKNKKRAVLITGRIHPGQSNASHVLQGFVRQILKNDEQSKKIRQMYVFYIIPMLNPDGVVAGNFRTSYSGKDLNRQFTQINKTLYPEIFYLSNLALKLKQKYKRRLQFYFDFHGHSSKKNLFCYGPEYPTSNWLFFKCRTFAKIIEEYNPIFSYRKSIFQISQFKRSTGRAYMLWDVKIPMTYTFEISNGMYETKQNKNIQLDQYLLREAGKTVFKGFYKYVCLQTKTPMNINAKAKVDTGIRNRKIISQKIVRQRSLTVSRLESSNVFKKQPETTDRSQTNYMNDEKQDFTIKQFQTYIQQIKKQANMPVQQAQGGSDSQGSQQDLTQEQLSKLQQFVKSRNSQTKQYNKKLQNFIIKPVKNKSVNKKKHKKHPLNQQQQLLKVMAQQQEKNKENKRTQNFNNNNLRINKVYNPNAGIESARRLYELGQKNALKKPHMLLPMNIKYEKVVLCQRNFTMEL